MSDKENPESLEGARERGKSKAELHDEDPEKHSGESSDDEDIPEELLMEMIRLKLTHGEAPKKEIPKVLEEVSLDGIVKHIKDGKAKNIVTMAGAGISTSAGIPDFRSPGTGLYDNLQKYDLPSPEAIFSIDFFQRKPEPFFHLAKELYPGNFDPTPCHYFVKLLEEKGLLLRHYTQNIDTLERWAGISDDKLIEAHGTFHSSHCVNAKCCKEYSQEFMKEKIFKDVIPRCDNCESLIKPDIVFFGESLPEKFFSCYVKDLEKCDLLIIMGTSLTVYPFARLVDLVSDTCPRLLINLTKAGQSLSMDFDSKNRYRDVAWLGMCDDGCMELAARLGWKEDLEKLIVEPKKGDEASKL